MSSYFKTFDSDATKSIQSNLNQVIDVIQEDISGSATRRKYQTFVTGGLGPGVTSSLYQTVYDQDFSLQTANPVLDMSVGLFHMDNGTTATKRVNLVTTAGGYSRSSTTGQLLFDSSHTMMVREKVNIYRQYANYLLGDPDAAFILDSNSYPSSQVAYAASSATSHPVYCKDSTAIMDACAFINIKRLFSRDGIRKETFALRLYRNAPNWDTTAKISAFDYQVNTAQAAGVWNPFTSDTPGTAAGDLKTPRENIGIYDYAVTGHQSSEANVSIIADLGSATVFNNTHSGGDVARLFRADDTTEAVGLIFYQAGIVVLNLGGSSILASGTRDNGVFATGTSNPSSSTDVSQSYSQSTSVGTISPVFEPRDIMIGRIDGMLNSTSQITAEGSFGMSSWQAPALAAGQVYIGHAGDINTGVAQGVTDHPKVDVNATFYPDLLISASIDNIVDHIGNTRFSSGSLTALAFQNQTRINSSIYFCRAKASEFNSSNNPTYRDNANVPIMVQDAANDKPFTYITTVVLADAQGIPVAIAKLNRPIEKNDESELTIRVRLDF